MPAYPTKRLALVNLSKTALTYSGVATHTMSLIQCAEAAGFMVDLFFDQHPRDRQRFIPEEFFAPFSDRAVVYTDGKSKLASQLNPLASAFDVFSIAMSLENLFQALQTRIYDVVIFNELFIALNAIISGFRHPSMWVYLHEHELFMDYLGSSLIPLWKRELMREVLRTLPVSGYLVQCEENVARVKAVLGAGEIIGDKVIKACPITLPGCSPDYSGARTGIAFVGSGEPIKNPELAIEVIEKLGTTETAHFYVGRGAKRLKKLLYKVSFSWTIHEKLSRTEMLEELSKRKLGIHTAKCEGYGLSVVEGMNYYPVLIPGEVEWAKHFPSAVKFSTVEDGGNKLNSLLSDDAVWRKAVDANQQHLSFNDVSKVGDVYQSLISDPHETKTTQAVKDIASKEGPIPYSMLLDKLGWADCILAAGASPKWSVKRYNTRSETVIVPDVYSISEVEGAIEKAYRPQDVPNNVSLF